MLLSGGIDSAAVAAVLASQTAELERESPLALSLRFPDPRVDESNVQTATARALGLPLHLASLDEAVAPDGVLGAGLETERASWLPPLNPWAAAYDELIRAGARTGCRTVFTGEGGNDLLEPSWDELARLAETGRFGALRHAAGLWQDYDPTTSTRRNAGLVLRRTLLRALQRAAGHRHVHAPVARAFRHRAGRRLPEWWLPDDRLRQAYADEAAAATLRGYRHDSIVENAEGFAVLLEATHLQGRRLNVAVRHPYFDVRLISFRAQLPLATLLYGGRYKGLGQKTFERRAIPGAGETRRPQAVSFAQWFGELLHAEVPKALDRLDGLPNLERLGVVRSGVLTPERGARKLANLGYYQCWHLLACEAWLSARPEGER